jgi:hypothetical protein
MNWRRMLVTAGLAVGLVFATAGCAAPPPLDPPMPSGGAQWAPRSAIPYGLFERGTVFPTFVPDDQTRWRSLARNDDAVWRWVSPASQSSGYALVRERKVLASAVTQWGMRGK